MAADQETIRDVLASLPSGKLAALKQLFWRELNYQRSDTPLSTRGWPEEPLSFIAAPPVLLATGGDGDGFHVIYIQLKDHRLRLAQERQIISSLIEGHPFSLFIFSNADQQYWHFVNVKYDHGKEAKSPRLYRRIAIGPEERLRTAAGRISLLDLANMGDHFSGISPLAIQQVHDEAFDVEKVTSEFFRAYQKIFFGFQETLYQQANDQQWAHDYALQFLNRLMFLYYFQRKRWLQNDTDFLGSFWRAYRESNQPPDTFVSNWLQVLFFEALNTPRDARKTARPHFPDWVNQALYDAPYLNGGLFARNELDRKQRVQIEDESFRKIFDFFEGYDFTISEDTPFDQEVAVDPEMIGIVYESLVNVSEEADERGEAGIFYTPRVEIDLMCRLSLVDWLVNHLGVENKDILYQFVFALDPEQKKRIAEELRDRNLWPPLSDLLANVSVLDPACGAGSFLVGILFVLDDLICRSNTELGKRQTDYERKKSIIANSLYGVDVMRWAVEAAELRLWLQLIADAPVALPEEYYSHPLLPNLSFKLRQGDSLVQEVGGINFSHRKGSWKLPSPLAAKIDQLKVEKKAFYYCGKTNSNKAGEQLRVSEFELYREILEARQSEIQDRIKELNQALEPGKNLFGKGVAPQLHMDELPMEQELERLNFELEQVNIALRALRSPHDIPFVWDIAFVEILEGGSGGFDIVIGNPPYVRQELIHDPRHDSRSVSNTQKRDYKVRLARSVYHAWPLSFGYNIGKDRASRNIDSKSDLYIYFYFHGLSLLNERGSFCFITSNSWLDVSYGKDLQEFFLNRTKLKFVIDNQVKRTFSSANVNTVIVLINSPRDTTAAVKEYLDHLVRYLVIKVPFAQVIDPNIWEEIEGAKQRKSLPEYRLHVASQNELIDEGTDRGTKTFCGDKWGGKYLRAPDIYWAIQQKAASRLLRIKDIAGFKRGFTTGANEFFFVDERTIKAFGIEDEFLMPVIRSPKECKHIFIDPEAMKYKVFLCNKKTALLKGTGAFEYIRYGEQRGFDERPTTRARTLWYNLGGFCPAEVLWLKAYHDRFIYPVNKPGLLAGDRFYEIRFKKKYELDQIALSLNNTYTVLSTEINGRVNLGVGALDNMVYEAASNFIVDPALLPGSVNVYNREVLPIEQELSSPDRRELDEIVFYVLGLTRIERDSLYEAVIDLTLNRLSRASSLDE